MVTEVMKVVMDDKAIEAIVSQTMELRDRENATLPVLETELREAESGIQNILNAIQMGILTKPPKAGRKNRKALRSIWKSRLPARRAQN